MTKLAPGSALEFTKSRAPGLLVTLVVAMAAAFLGSHYKGSVLLFALLLGLALHFVSEDKRCSAGIQFASSTVLRLGVALLGLRITIDHVVTLGWQTVVALMLAVSLTILMGLFLARLFKVESSLGLLIGGATAICGASAALAISSVLPKNAHLERNTTLTVVGVTTLSTMAMVVYPLITKWLGFDEVMSGKFIGATIHDVAQVVGAGYSLSTEAGDAATITKLMRVAFLMPVLVVISLVLRVRTADKPASEDDVNTSKTPLLPWFTVAFVVFMLLNSTGWVPTSVQSGASFLSQSFLVLAIAGVGLKTSLKEVTQLGWRPIAMIFFVTLGLAFMAGGYLITVQ
ncbi:putative sulfate exporter family transporter [Limnohabitans sp. Rim8]|jgi:uncharacterized integral membrane protein (TIGR00698 family)|uniref:YeiH family protein n=1 Tax=Limnohabitans sp. Rim8 TaxID=1100718 RepID=UPI0025DD7445|nr:putative sulfate exporter family transporter [Limnohabitans sp. Rim8]